MVAKALLLNTTNLAALLRHRGLGCRQRSRQSSLEVQLYELGTDKGAKPHLDWHHPRVAGAGQAKPFCQDPVQVLDYTTHTSASTHKCNAAAWTADFGWVSLPSISVESQSPPLLLYTSC
jgi:hypothetical protein